MIGLRNAFLQLLFMSWLMVRLPGCSKHLEGLGKEALSPFLFTLVVGDVSAPL